MRGCRARTTKSKDRIERYEALKNQEAPETDDTVQLAAASSRLGKKLIELHDVSKSYEGRTVIRDFSYNLLRNDRIGIVGHNGAGKSTLLRLFAGELSPDSGTVDITFTGESMQTYQPDLGMIGMPYLIQSDEQMEKVLTGEVGQEFEGLMEACGMKCLGYFTRGPRYITSTKKITSVADCNNLVIRTPQSAMTVAAFQALGAKPTPMALSEVFTSLQQGTIEAQENPLAMIETQSFYEVCPYLILTAHLRAWVYIAMGLAQYNRLSDSQKAVVDQAGAECQAYEHELFLDNEEKYYNQLQEQGMEFIEVDTQEFADAMVSGVLPILTDSQKKIYDAIEALA